MKTPTERANEAIEAPVDPTDRTSIARARTRVAGEASLTRDAVRNLASGYLGPDELDLLESAVKRLRRLVERSDELGRMSQAALQAQVDADEPGKLVTADGRIRDRAEVAAEIMGAIDSGDQERARDLLDAALGAPGKPAAERPSFRQEFRLADAFEADRCATDLRARGFRVARAADRLTLLVETPAGWTGTLAEDVVMTGHDGSLVAPVSAATFDIVMGQQ
jgi:HAMP domain-containing protein